MRFNISQISLIFIVGMVLYLNSLTVKAEVIEARGHHFGQTSIRQRSSLLDTFSLSFVGNFDFSQIMEGTRKIFEGLATFIDLKVIKSGVDYLFDRFVGDIPDNEVVPVQTKNGILARKDDFVGDDLDDVEMQMYLKKRAKHRNLRNGVTALVGAVLQKQQCWENTACRVGQYLEGVAAKDVIFIMADRMLTPGKWQPTLDIIKQSAKRSAECQEEFQCDPTIDGRNL